MSAEHDTNQCAIAWTVLRRAHARIAAALEAALASQCGLTLSEFDALLALSLSPDDGCTISALAPSVALSQPALSRLINRLENRGWIERTRIATDARQVHVSLTSSGRDHARSAIHVHAEVVHANLATYLSSDDQQSLVTILAKLTPDSFAAPAIPAPTDQTPDRPRTHRS